MDEATKELFLVDTGSSFSILPHQSSEPASGPAISTADRTPIKCWGSRQRTLFSANHRFSWKFLLAAVAFPILGADFLENFDLMVDLKRRHLIRANRFYVELSAPPPGCNAAPIGVVADDKTSTTSSAAPSSSSPSGGYGSTCSPPSRRGTGQREEGAVDAARVGMDEREMEKLFPEVVNKSKKLPPVRHKVEHIIETTCTRPISSRYRRLDPAKLEAAKKEFAEMEAQGIIRRSSSSWSSPLHMVEKADGTWRPCGDYRRVNLATKPDLYPPPHMEDLSARLAGKVIFSKLDLRKGYYQIPVAREDVHKTAIITPFGLFEFLRMPFGLRNAGQSFQRFMDSVLEGLPHVFVYLDDVLVASTSREEHRRDLEEVMKRLKHQGLVLNREKCTFYATSVEYLGHVVSAAGISPLPTRVEAIQKLPAPSTRGELQRFLGMTNYYRRFIRGAASILKPLTDATRGPGGRATRLTWTAEMEKALQSAKRALVQAVPLVHPRAGGEISLAVDASDHHVGGVLQQREAGTWRPLAYYSRKMNDAEAKYSTFDRELLACVAAIRHFRFLLEGREFIILSDHKPLSYALHRVSDAWSARQQRHLAYVAEYTSVIRHVAGAENLVADALSRPPTTSSSSPSVDSRSTCSTPAEPRTVSAVVPPSSAEQPNWPAIAVGQATCHQTESLLKSQSLQLKRVTVGEDTVWCETSTGTLRPLIPVGHRQAVFDSVHGLAHAGTRATTRLITSRYVWPGLASDVKSWCQQCVQCQRAKVTQQETTATEKIAIPAGRFTHVHQR